MPVAPRTNKKATRIAFSIIGIPDNLKECFKGFRKLNPKHENNNRDNYTSTNTNANMYGSDYQDEF